MIARDEQCQRILGVIPLEGGFCLVKKPRDSDILVVESTFRQYTFKFSNHAELQRWYFYIQKVSCRELKVKKYTKRVQAQNLRLEEQNPNFKYKMTLNSIGESLKDLSQLMRKKQALES